MTDAYAPAAASEELQYDEVGSPTVTGSVLAATLARKKLQQDVELMQNRVERLRAEERKAKQKVLETKLRGQEIAALQKRNEQAAAAKMLAKTMEEDQRRREVQQQRAKRSEQRVAIKKVQSDMHEARHADVRAEKEIKAENMEMVRSLKTYDLARAQKARAEIRQHQKMVSAKFEKQRQAHQEFLAQDFINMIAMEDRRREDVEKEIAVMEEDERKHIERLRALQEEQRLAYDALEAALAPKALT